MLSLLWLLVPMFSILGFANSLAYVSGATVAISIFCVTFSLLLLQTAATLLHALTISTPLIFVIGCSLYLAVLGICFYKGEKAFLKSCLQLNAVFLILWLLGCALVYGIDGYATIDSYRYWGAISKYLFLFGHLPTAPMPYAIDPSHLSYTPGMAAFHYMFYAAYGRFVPDIAWFAQISLVCSCLIVLWRPGEVFASCVRLALVVLLTNLAFGFFLYHLQVDYLLALVVFSVLYVLQASSQLQRWWLIAPAILSLYFIKQAGLLFALLCVAAVWMCALKSKQSYQAIGIYTAIMLLSLGLSRFMWQLHFKHAGFSLFAQGLNLHQIARAMLPFSKDFAATQWAMLKGILFGHFDKTIKIPYVVLYVLLGVLWVKHFSKSQRDSSLQRQSIIIRCCAVGLMVYLLAIYLLQALTFHAGVNYHHLLSFSRYYNALFLPALLFCVVCAYDYSIRLSATGHSYVLGRKSLTYSLLFLAPLLLLGGSVQAKHRFAKWTLPEKQLSHAVLGVLQHANPNARICVWNVRGAFTNFMDPFQFYMLPRIVHYCSTASSCKKVCAYRLDFAYSHAEGHYRQIATLPYGAQQVTLLQRRQHV